MENVELREVIELFLNITIHEIRAENETPDINFIFMDNDLKCLYDVIINPFQKENSWTPNATKEDLLLLLKHSEYVPCLLINNTKEFFELLTNIINEYLNLSKKDNITRLPRSTAMNILRRIWLRMTEEDLKDTNAFLRRELAFLKDETLDELFRPKVVDIIKDYLVRAKVEISPTYDETSRSVHFDVLDNDGIYAYVLPHINYEICEENGTKTCYIFAVQNDRGNIIKKSKKFQRQLYKLNKGIDNPSTHPSRVYSLLLFLELLKEKGIQRIKVPKGLVLDYRYHILMSQKEKERFPFKWNSLLKERDTWSEFRQREYEHELEFFNSVVDKAELIKENKTTKLFELMDRILINYPSLEEEKNHTDTLNFTLKK